MAVVTISEAAKQANVGRATIYRYLDSGKLSASTMPDGSRGIDTSELMRVFGEIRLPDSDVRRIENENGHDLIRENAHLRELLAAKDEHIETLKQAMRLIEDKRLPVTPVQDDQAKASVAKLSDLEAELNQARVKASELTSALEAERGKGFFARLFKR